jgi:hypothetical protein
VFFERMAGEAETVRLGAGLNKAYAAALKTGKRSDYRSVLERAKAAAEDYLAHFPTERRGAILLRALASMYDEQKVGSDTAVWLAHARESASGTPAGVSRGQPSIASQTISALREIGLLNELVATREGLVVYPAQMIQPEA